MYTFKIRQGVKFTDGTPLTAHIVKENFDNIIKDKNSLKWLESVVLTKEYKALDDHTFELPLSSPYYPLLAELGMARPFGMGSPKTFVKGEPRKVTAAVGTGPYIMGEHKQDEYLNMYVNKDYWGPKPCNTPLMAAASYGATEALKASLKNGADVSVKDSTGKTALMHAAYGGFEEGMSEADGHVEIIQMLLAHKADPNEKNNEGASALDIAMSANSNKTAVELLKKAAKK